eukprot:TRINITY_DN1884_c0_g1_i1.p1 TRINITY_DN1884_c0_g1~~TRINITY_DN1884_c0_g1_i1.p1  ORF type:complete len:180 (+),score=48.62 TRINITY_DN1884_c0_g1_i1:1-540(+)
MTASSPANDAALLASEAARAFSMDDHEQQKAREMEQDRIAMQTEHLNHSKTGPTISDPMVQDKQQQDNSTTEPTTATTSTRAGKTNGKSPPVTDKQTTGKGKGTKSRGKTAKQQAAEPEDIEISAMEVEQQQQQQQHQHQLDDDKQNLDIKDYTQSQGTQDISIHSLPSPLSPLSPFFF